MNAKSEYANRNPEIERICDCYLNTVEKQIAIYLEEDRYKDSRKLALQIWMLFQGAVFSSQLKNNSEPVLLAKSAAKVLLHP